MTINMPQAIEAYFTVDRDGGPDDLPAVLTENAVIRDAGETVVGHDAIRNWKVDYTRKYGSTTADPFFITTENGKTIVTAHVAGDFPGSPVDLRYFFVLAGGKIGELEITI